MKVEIAINGTRWIAELKHINERTVKKEVKSVFGWKKSYTITIWQSKDGATIYDNYLPIGKCAEHKEGR